MPSHPCGNWCTKNHTSAYLALLEIEPYVETIQKSAILRKTKILRKVLEVSDDSGVLWS